MEAESQGEIWDDEESWLVTLPIEIWTLIFSYLSLPERVSLSRVCRSWHSFIFLSFTSLELSLRQRNDQEEIASKLLRKCTNLRDLCFRDCFQLSGAVLSQLASASDLLKLEMYNCPHLMRTIGNSDLRALPESLTALRLSGCPNIDDDACELLPRQLRTLDLTGCTKLTDVGLLLLPQSLTSLSLASSQSAFAALGGLPATLQELSLANASTKLVLQPLPRSLVHVDLGNCSAAVTDDSIVHLSTLLRLRWLSLERCSLVSNAGIAQLPPSLQHLNLRQCARITDECFATLPRPLQSLNAWACPRVTLEGVSHLPPGLVSLNLADSAVTDAVCAVLPGSLRSLCLFRCTQLTDESTVALPASLTELDMSWCRLLSDRGVDFLTARCRRLKRLTLAHCPNVSRSALDLLHNALPALETVQRGIVVVVEGY